MRACLDARRLTCDTKRDQRAQRAPRRAAPHHRRIGLGERSLLRKPNANRMRAPSRPGQMARARDAADGGGARDGARALSGRRDIPPRSAPGSCEAARAKGGTVEVSDAPAEAVWRILLAAVSVWRRRGLGMAGRFASRYETKDEHDARKHILCWSTDVPRWTVCGLVCCLHVVHGFALRKASLREQCARLECCINAYERFDNTIQHIYTTGTHGAERLASWPLPCRTT